MQLEDTLWSLEPHTNAKHELIKRYIGAWSGILGSQNKSVLYIDGFSGPGKYTGGEPGSPIIVLKTFISQFEKGYLKSADLFFIEERKDRIEFLQNELQQIISPNGINVQPINGLFEDEIPRIITKYKTESGKLPPSFTFIDPCGFKGAPYEIVRELLSNDSSEVFINVMAEYINRFLTHSDDQIKSHIISFYGTQSVINISSTIGDRISELRNLYFRQLKKIARFVRHFEMRDEDNRVIYYLFFATNNLLGFTRMKEAMWKIDSQTGLSFSDARDPDQMILLSMDPVVTVKQIVSSQFRGQKVRKESLEQYIIEQTDYISPHLTSALKQLEIEGKIKVQRIPKIGSRRASHGFPSGTIIEFV